MSDEKRLPGSPDWERILQEHQEIKSRLARIEEHVWGKEGAASEVTREETDNIQPTAPVEEAIHPPSSTMPEGEVTPPSPPSPPSPPTPPLTKPSSKPKPRKDLEFQIGGTLLNRIGIVAVIIGLIIFLKYSFDNEWIGPVGRVSLGILAGFVLIFFGERWKSKYRLYAQGLFGGGSLALYISVYSAFDFYSLIGPVLTFLFFVAITALTVVLAVRHSSLAIGILGLIGGYATPLLVGSTSPSLWSWFGYLTVLTLGVLAVSIYKKWYVFQYLSFIFVQLSIAAAHLDLPIHRETEHWWPAYLFSHVVLFLYLGIATGYNLRRAKKATTADVGLILTNALFFFGWTVLLLESTWVDEYLGYYSLILSLGYIWLGRWAYRLAPEDKGQVYALFIAAFIFMTLAIPLQLSEDYLAIAWYAEALGLIYAARRIPAPRMLFSALVVLSLGVLVLLLQLQGLPFEKTFLFNIPTLVLLLTLVTLFGGALLLRGVERSQAIEYTVRQLLVGALLLFVFVGISILNQHYFTLSQIEYFLSPEQLSLSALWLLYGIALFWLGLKRRIAYLRYLALGLLGIVILKAFFVDLSQLAAIYKILLFIVLGLSLLGVSYFYQRQKNWMQGDES